MRKSYTCNGHFSCKKNVSVRLHGSTWPTSQIPKHHVWGTKQTVHRDIKSRLGNNREITSGKTRICVWLYNMNINEDIHIAIATVDYPDIVGKYGNTYNKIHGNEDLCWWCECIIFAAMLSLQSGLIAKMLLELTMVILHVHIRSTTFANTSTKSVYWVIMMN